MSQSDLQEYLGQVVVIVNTASQCGFTKQYADLQKLYEDYKDQGLVVLGFPSNDFLKQEPGSDEEISEFCEMKFGVTFPLFPKAPVKGKNTQPVFQWLKEKTGKSPRWNFYKFILNRQGEAVKVFSSLTSPKSKRFLKTVESLL